MILQDEALANLTIQEEASQSPPPPTAVVTVNKYFTITDYNEMLSLAQKKFDQMRQRNRERSSSVRYGKASSMRRRPSESAEELKISQLLSSLLYLSLMMQKVDDMKKLLEASDSMIYNEWQPLLESMHSPMFHLRERRIHNDRAKKVFNRKRKYKELYEEAKGSVSKLEDSSQQLSHTLSKMSEENLKSQTLLEEKAGVEKMLSTTEKEVGHLREQLHRQEIKATEKIADFEVLQSTLKDVEIEKHKLAQKIDEDTKHAAKIEIRMTQLESQIEQTETKLNSIDKKLVASEKENECLKNQLKMQTVSQDHLLNEKEMQISQTKESCANLQSLLEKVNKEMKDIVSRHGAEKERIQKSLSDANTMIEITSTKLKVAQEEKEGIRGDLKSKTEALQKALETSNLEQHNQGKLREIISSKDKEILQVNETRQVTQLKLVEMEGRNKSETKELEDKISRLEEQIVSLRGQINHGSKVRDQLNGDIDKARISELQLRGELASLQSFVEQRGKDFEKTKEESKGLERKLVMQTQASKETEDKLNGRIYEIEKNLLACSAEKNRLAEVLETLKGDMEQSANSASVTKETAEARAKESETKLIDTKLQLAKAQAEIDVLKASNASFERSLTDALQSKVASKDEQASLLQKSMIKLNDENRQLTQQLEMMRVNLVQDMKTSLEKQISAEIKEAQLQNQLKMSRDSALSKLIDSENSANSKFAHTESVEPSETKNSALKSNFTSSASTFGNLEPKVEAAEIPVEIPVDFPLMHDSVQIDKSSTYEHDFAKDLVAEVLARAVCKTSE